MAISDSSALLKRVDEGLMLTLVLTLFAALPLALKPGLPAGTEASLHIDRVEQIQSEVFLSPSWWYALRLTENAAQTGLDGSLPYIITSGLRSMLGIGVLEAWRGLIFLCLLMASGGMHLFCRRRSGRLGGVLAGLVYVYSPALMYTMPYVRGAFPVLLALALFPLLLWRVDALRDKPNSVNALLAFLLQFAMFNAQPLMALLLTVLAIGWVAFETIVQTFNREASQMRASSGTVALLLLLLGAFAAAPTGLDTVVNVDLAPTEVSSETGYLDDRARFVQLETLLSPPPLADAGAINGLREPSSIGIASWTLALAGGISALWLYIRGYRTRHPQAFIGTLYFALLALILLTLLLKTDWYSPFFRSLWPGPLAAGLAIVASMNGIWMTKLERRYQLSTIALMVALPIAAAIPLVYVPEWQSGSLPREWQDNVATAPAQASDAAAVVSGIAMGLLLALAWRLRKQEPTPRPYWTVAALGRTASIGVAVGGAIALLFLFITFREGVVWINSPPGMALPAQNQQTVTFDSGVKLLGYDISSDAFRPGETVLINAYWYAPEPPAVDYSAILYVLGEDGLVTSRFKGLVGGRASSLWGQEGYIVDSYRLRLPVDLSAGAYHIGVGLLDCASYACREILQSSDVVEHIQVYGDRTAVTTILVEAD